MKNTEMRKKGFLSLAFLLVMAMFAPGAAYFNPCDEYVPNEIIVKFHETVAETIEKQLKAKTPVSELKLSRDLDKLNTRHQAKEINPLFKNFSKKQQEQRALQGKSKAFLTEKEKHILQRLKRASKDAGVLNLSGVYKLQLDLELGQSLEEVVDAYQTDPNVEYAELNYIVSICKTPDDALYTFQWPLHNSGQYYPVEGGYALGTPDCDIDMPKAWDVNTGTSKAVIAVVDTGVDYTHRDLDDNIWINEAELNGSIGVDDDENGFVDDIYGYDFCTYGGETRDPDPMDASGHGTHCAGVIAAGGNNGLDITGICWHGKIMALRFADPQGTGKTSDAAAAIYYAVENGADVISLSWGGSSSSRVVKDATAYADSQGVIVVAAAGNKNSSSRFYPAYYNHVIGVAATDSHDQKALFSNYGGWVDIAAPGLDILSLRAQGTSLGTVYNDYTTIESGTSMACPHVAGACALLLSFYPEVQIEELKQALMESADPISSGICASGRLNVYEAMLRMPRPQGIILLDSDFYSCFGSIGIKMLDSDLKGHGSQGVSVETETGDFETVILTEIASIPGVFTATIPTTSGSPSIEDSTVQLSHGETITATYEDEDDGTGNPSTATDTAIADCQGPVVFNIEVGLPGRQPRVSFETDEPTTTRVLCGLACGGPYLIEASDPTLKTSHTMKLTGVSPETDYYFVIEAVDALGNETIDDNNGLCYLLTTTGPQDVYVPSQCSTIQEAVDNCWDNMVVWVADGTYKGKDNRDIDFEGRPLSVRSENGPENCIIDCNGTTFDHRCGFYFHSGEGVDSVLDGFTIRNGYAPRYGGGIRCDHGSPTIMNCIITDNIAGRGGGIYCYNGEATISNCVIRDNLADNGGGIYSFLNDPAITNCTISSNSALRGSGIFCVDGNVTIINCVISGNSYTHVGKSKGSGIYCLKGDVKVANCTLSDNTAVSGGGIYSAEHSNLILDNCTFWKNEAANGSEIYLDDYSNARVNYSDVQGGQDGIFVGPYSTLDWGFGNIDADPCFAFPDDYHLLPDSPCVDAGDNAAVPPSVLVDLGGNPRFLDNPNIVDTGNGTPPIVDMGAYEYNDQIAYLAVSPDIIEFFGIQGGSNPAQQNLFICNTGGGILNWEATIPTGCDWLDAYPLIGESAGEVDKVTLSTDMSGLDVGSYSCELSIFDPNAIHSPTTAQVVFHIGEILRVPNDFLVIQAAIDAANDYDMVLVADGTYTGEGNRDIDFHGKAITLKSENGPENCVIDCNASERNWHQGFYFHSGEDSNSVLDGFTIVNGCHWDGGAIFSDGGSPIITNCIIRNNEAVQGGGGICFFYGNPIVKNCTFFGNSAPVGGAIATGGNDLKIINCDISDNSADTGGGIVLWGDGNPILSHCTLTGNSAEEGGAVSSWMDSSPMITNCIITGNTAVREYGGGGIVSHTSNPTIYNCTISNNLAGGDYPYGGGISCESGDNLVLNNCILWGNEATEGQEIHLRRNSNAWLSYTDVQDNQEDIHVGSNCTLNWGAGNVDMDPCFVEPGYWDANETWFEGDYHLLDGSPCIDSGDPNFVLEPNEIDLDGNHRLLDGDNDSIPVIDMGAYEYNPPIEVEMKFTPQTLNCESRGNWVKAHILLPEGISPEDIDVNEPAVAEPVGTALEYIMVHSSNKGPVKVEIVFDREAFCSAVPDTNDGYLDVSVIGYLKTGRYFSGTDTIRIIGLY